MNFIEMLKYIILGIIQGITEPLPISSSGHLVIFKNIFDFSFLSDLNFEIFVNFGSLLAIIFIFRKDIVFLFNNFFKFLKTKNKEYQANFNYVILLIIATIPAGIIGLLFKDNIEEIFKDVKFVGIFLLVTALFLFLIRNIKGNKSDNEITLKDAIIIGLFQSIALLPGISRSGATIIGGAFRKLNREAILKFSFLLYIPISLASMLKGVLDFNNPDLLIYYILGLIASFFATLLSTKLLFNIIKKGKLIYFVFYCIIVGTLTIIFL